MNISTRLSFEGLNNTRDLGGIKAADGRRIRPLRLIRSGQLYFATKADVAELSKIVGAVADLRTDREIMEKPDPDLVCAVLRLPIMTDMTAGVTREKNSDEKAFEEVLESEKYALRYMCAVYRGFIENEAAINGYKRFVKLLLENESGAVLWHCTAGKDRAGFAAVITQALLGVPMQDIKEDYLYTNACLEQEISTLIDHLGKDADDKRRTTMKTLFGAREEFLVAALDCAQEIYGSLDGYIEKALGVTDEERRILQSKYLE